MGFQVNDDCECGHGTKSSHRLDDFGGLQCDHCDSSECIDGFEDENGEPVKQYVNAEGYLQDQPFDAFTRAVAKMTAATALICAIAFYVGYATGGK